MTHPKQARQSLDLNVLWAPASAGELLDKLTILELKVARLVSPAAVANARRELELVRDVCAQATLLANPRISPALEELRAVNGRLWDVEDALRDHERSGVFDGAFVELARSVYRHNDRRHALKCAINHAVGSTLLEEKSYGSAAGQVTR